MTFRNAYITRQGRKIHVVALRNKAVQILATEQEAREAADNLNCQEKNLRTPAEKAEWFTRWANMADQSEILETISPIPHQSETAEYPKPPEEGDDTPWGEAQTVTHLGAGVYAVDTASHGGLYLPDPVWDELPQAVQLSMFLVRTGQRHGNWAEEDSDLAVVMPFIIHLLDTRQLQQHFNNNAADPGYWRRHAVGVCALYPDEYGEALPLLQALETEQPYAA